MRKRATLHVSSLIIHIYHIYHTRVTFHFKYFLYFYAPTRKYFSANRLLSNSLLFIVNKFEHVLGPVWRGPIWTSLKMSISGGGAGTCTGRGRGGRGHVQQAVTISNHWQSMGVREMCDCHLRPHFHFHAVFWQNLCQVTPLGWRPSVSATANCYATCQKF